MVHTEPERIDAQAAEATRKARFDNVVPPDFSLCRGGTLYRLGRSLGLRRGSGGLVRLGLAFALLTWVPLAVLASLVGAFSQSPVVSFWQSTGTHVRLLVAIPLFFAAEAVFDLRVTDVLRRLLDIGLVLPRDEPRLAAAVREAIRWRDSVVMGAALVALTIGLIWSGHRTDLPLDVSTWRTNAAGGLTPAGWWYNLVCIPTFQFLLWRWCWRLLIWSRLLWRLARLDLQLIPTHPDRAGGLGGLGVAHVDLAPLGFAAASVLSASYAEQMLFAGVAPAAFAVSMTAAIVGATLTMIAPLLFFTPRLINAKQQALLEYGTLAAAYSREFRHKWLRDGSATDQPLLGTPDIQSLADLGSSFEGIRKMTVLPIATFQILLLAAAIALPFVPLVFLAFPLDQLIMDSLKAVLNI
jgi:hypothetical protein